MTDHDDIRAMLDRVSADDPVSPGVQDDLARGRGALRRRRLGITAGAFGGVVAIALAGFALSPGLLNASDPSFAGGTPTPVQCETPAPTGPYVPCESTESDETPLPTPEATPTPSKVTPAGNRPRIFDCPPSTMTEQIDCKLPLPTFEDTLLHHLGRDGLSFRNSGLAAGVEVTDYHYAESGVVVSLFAAVLSIEDPAKYLDPGPGGEPCAVRPIPNDGGTIPYFTWTTCTAEAVPEGTLYLAEGEDENVQARGATLVTKDGTYVSVANSTRREADEPELPLDHDKLRAIVLDPAMR